MGVDPLSLGLIQTRGWGGSGISHKQDISSEIRPQLKDNPWIPGEADTAGWGSSSAGMSLPRPPHCKRCTFRSV